ncbi:hypothetical protein LJC42_01660 [Eubacteriales bacterium OttesenSCG-928-K08]|nr:hypothetical protein [Eubacteriales bacterium OttesenSCG-928-K08]
MQKKKTVASVAILITLGLVIALLARSCGAQKQEEAPPSEPMPEQSAAISSTPSESMAPTIISPSPASTIHPDSTDSSKQDGQDGGSQATATPQGNTGGGNPPAAPSTPAPITQPEQAPPPTPAPEPTPPPAQPPAPEPEPESVLPDPPPPQTRTICNTCGADITGNVPAHGDGHLLNGEDFSYRVE